MPRRSRTRADACRAGRAIRTAWRVPWSAPDPPRTTARCADAPAHPPPAGPGPGWPAPPRSAAWPARAGRGGQYASPCSSTYDVDGGVDGGALLQGRAQRPVDTVLQVELALPLDHVREQVAVERRVLGQ